VKIKICVVGQGYVGLPLALSFAEYGYKVFGLDNSIEKVKKITLGQSPVEDIDNARLSKAIKMGSYTATTDYALLKGVNVFIVCVPTPLDRNHKPDLSYLFDCLASISKYISKGDLIIIESTVAPGTIKNYVIPLLEKESGMKIDNFDIAYSPERIDPLNQKWNLVNTTKIVAGLTEVSKLRAKELYLSIIDNVVESSSLEAAETAKLLENSFRLVNISLINEISIFCRKYGIDVTEVVRLAATKPYGFMPFYSGLGAGGHCIPVDPLYLADKSREIGVFLNIIEVADSINRNMPGYFVNIAEEKLSSLNGKRVLVIGVSYKPNVADVRETPVEALILGLKDKGAEVFWHDDLVKEWNGEKSVTLSSEYDLAILATPHDYLDLTKLRDVPILNTRGSI
jgi:UDP-N-acetyl-D-glucosamine dehydrogenase